MSLNSDNRRADMRGFVLAAGFGTRLLPITRIIPKALVPFTDGVLMDGALRLMAQCGISDIGVNGHHHLDKVSAYAGRRDLSFFPEPAILGTGGYLTNLGTFFDRPLLVANCDTIFLQASGTMDALVAVHRESDRPVTMVLRPRGERSVTSFSLADNGVVSMGEGPFMFTGMYAVSPSILPLLDGPDIVPVFRQLSDSGRLGGVVHDGPWFDAGTREGLIAAHRAVGDCDSYVYGGSEIAKDAELKDCVIYPGCRIRPGTKVYSSVLMKSRTRTGELIEGEIRI